MSCTILEHAYPKIPKLMPTVNVEPECTTSPSIKVSMEETSVFVTIEGVESPDSVISIVLSSIRQTV